MVNLDPIAVWLRRLSGRSVLVTGHTGFKGAWLCEWLIRHGARVSGLSLPPDYPDSVFERLRLADRLENHYLVDIRNRKVVTEATSCAQPDVIFHLAAQALVRRSYRDPIYTWDTNVMGTINVLESARALCRPVTVVAVTTDKVYRNREWEFAYREEDELGGHDPYSSSKAACEIAVQSWRLSFGEKSGVRVATARAGNVIGGGDFIEDRIVPDCMRAWAKGDLVNLRSPNATRPWQFVLDPISGYLRLAQYLEANQSEFHAFNFGPGEDGDRSVVELVRRLSCLAEGRDWAIDSSANLHEARSLALSIDRARKVLGWRPCLSFIEAVRWTHEGYQAETESWESVVSRQISDFEARMTLAMSKD